MTARRARGAPLAALAATLLLVAAPQARAAAPLLLDEVLASVERSYPPLLDVRQEPVLAAADLLSARGAFDPVWRTRLGLSPISYYPSYRLDSIVEQPTPFWGATLFAGYRLGLGYFADYDGKLQTNDWGELRAGLQLPLLRNGWIDRRRATIRRAEIGQRAAGHQVAEARLQARRTATQRYYEWIAAGRRYEIAAELLRVAADRDAQLAGRVAQGDLAAIERRDNQRIVAQREAGMVSARRGLEQAALDLSLFLRDEGGAPIIAEAARLPAALPEPAPLPAEGGAEAARAATARRPEVRRVEALREGLRIERDLARNQLWPALDVGAVVSRDLGPGSPTRDKFELELGVTLDVSLVNRVARGRARAADAVLARADQQVRFTRDRAATEVQDALSALSAARQRVEIARRELALARELAEAERTRFSLGDSSLIFVNLREQTAAETAAREVDALLDYQRALAAYRAAAAQDV